MKIAVFDARSYDRQALNKANENFGHDLTFFEPKLTTDTVSMIDGHKAVCSFIHDDLSEPVLTKLKEKGVGLIDLRSAGFNHVDLVAARKLGLKVARAPDYSPHAIAEHAVALILALNRKLHHAYLRELTHNFSLEGLVGFDLNGKTVGVIGTGKIGAVFAKIMLGFGCKVIGFDPHRNSEVVKLGVEYFELDEVFRQSDILSLHSPLTPDTHHIIDADALSKMKHGVMLINTGRGALVDSKALIDALKKGKVGAAGLDVYEEEEGIFHENLYTEIIPDEILMRLMSFPNVLITSHQAFLTREALQGIAQMTLENARQFENGETLTNEVLPQ